MTEQLHTTQAVTTSDIFSKQDTCSLFKQTWNLSDASLRSRPII